MLVQNGFLTDDLIIALEEIFLRYRSGTANNELDQIEAARLWYQCGLRLSSLNEILHNTKLTETKKSINFEDFRCLLQRIINDDEKHFPVHRSEKADQFSDFEVRVEVMIQSLPVFFIMST